MSSSVDVGSKLKLDSNESDSTEFVPLYSGPRGVAVRVLCRTESSDSYIDRLIKQELQTGQWSPYDRALLIDLIYGTLRWRNRLDWVLTGFYHGEFSKCIPPVKYAMRVALYQILMLSKIAPNVAITECANLVRRIKDDKSAGIIAGVLKNIVRNVETIRYPPKDDNLQVFYSVTLSHPLWLVKRWCERFGNEEAEKMLSANNDRPSIHLRVNTVKTNLAAIMNELKAAECVFELSQSSTAHVRVGGLQDLESLEIYKNGMMFRSDCSDELVAQLCSAQASDEVLVLGAGNISLPFVLAQHYPDAKVSAAVLFPTQVIQHQEAASLLGLQNMSAMSSDALGDKSTYKLVVAHAKSSELGLLHRKPELRWSSDVDAAYKHRKAQQQMLSFAAAYVQAKGTLVYLVESVEPEETTAIVDWFTSAYPDFTVSPAGKFVSAEFCAGPYLQTLVHSHKMNSIFAVRFIKNN